MLVAEYWRIFVVSVLGAVLGFIFDQVVLGLLIGLIVYISYHLHNIHKLSRWLTHAKSSAEPPEGRGVWQEIFDRIYGLQKRNKSQKIKLASALTRFQDAASAMPDGMLILKQDSGKIEWFNQATKRLLGFKSPQDIDQPITNFIRYPSFIEFMEMQVHSDIGIDIISPANENIIVQIQIVPYGKGKALMIARDVTKVNQLEQVRQQFVANISHELRTPLTVLTGYMETLLGIEKKPKNEWFDPMQQMYTQTLRMEDIVKDLLLLTRIENNATTGNEVEVDIPELVKMLLEEAKMLGVDKKHALTADYDHFLKIRGRRADLHSAFSNLVSNAVRYTPPGGKIHLKWYANEKGAHFVVIDSGLGISQMNIPHLTERFFRVDDARSRDTGGTGLGLAIVKHVLNGHDGFLSIESQLNIGSKFSCNFPLERIATENLERDHSKNDSA